MYSLLILFAVIIFACIFLNNASSRLGIPVLFAFILLGIIFGNSGLMSITDDDASFVGDLCSVALVFIMFYGGFGTSWTKAREVSLEAGLLSTLGVVLTAGIVGLFCHYLLGWNWVEAFLLGSVLSSTDAASVFFILRSKKLGLKNNTASLLEMESGSNDPMSNILTVLMLSIMQGKATAGSSALLLAGQLGLGVIFGICFAVVAVFAVKRIKFVTSGFNSLFFIAVAMLSYALPSIIGGNGYLSAYIVGLVLGNQHFEDKKEMVHFFDGFTSLAQVLIFFSLGLLARPLSLGRSIVPALLIFFILVVIARPVSVALLLSPFRRYKLREQALVSFSGVRGASSIVFAIVATVGGQVMENDLFSVVFCVVLLSIALQGSLIPFISRKLGMIDNSIDVMQTFSDFSETVDLQFSEILVRPDDLWCGKKVKDLGLPKDVLLCSIVHADGTRSIPVGNSVLNAGEVVIMCSRECDASRKLHIHSTQLSNDNKWVGSRIMDLPYSRGQILMIQRGEETIIPNGNTVLHGDDIIYINQD